MANPSPSPEMTPEAAPPACDPAVRRWSPDDFSRLRNKPALTGNEDTHCLGAIAQRFVTRGDASNRFLAKLETA